MINNRRLFAAVLLAAVWSLAVYAQDNSGKIVTVKFVSVDGGFKIDLPNTIDESIRPVGSMSSGAGSFTWRVPEGTFTVGYVEGVSVVPGEGFRALNELAAAAEAAQAKAGAKIVDKCEFSLDGAPGIELRAERPAGIRSINRFILAGGRLFILTADWPSTSDGRSAKKILDSFELADTRALTA
jgi:hypothetical protein